MSRILDKCRLCRRSATKLYLKGDRCYTTKCAIVKRNYPPGMSGAKVGISGSKKGRSRMTPYGIQLREKQKARFYYGITEKQMSNYFVRANRALGNSGEILMQLLETRLDNVVYRLGWAGSHQKARQLVNHGHITVDGKKVTIPSYRVKSGQAMGVRVSSQVSKVFQEVMPALEKIQTPGWIHTEKKSFEGKIVSMPTLSEVNPLYDVRLITEYYSR